jgi:hypothetical protein
MNDYKTQYYKYIKDFLFIHFLWPWYNRNFKKSAKGWFTFADIYRQNCSECITSNEYCMIITD